MLKPLLLISLLLLSLTACAAPAVTPQAESQATATPQPTPGNSFPSPVPTFTSASLAPSSQAIIQPTQEVSTPAPSAAPDLCSPLVEHSLAELPEIVSDPYAPPPPGKEERHHGVDFSYYRRGERLSIEGVGVQSVFPGVVAASITDRFPYGNMVIIETPFADVSESVIAALGLSPDESIYTLYAHMGAAPAVELGERVAACQALGQVGKSGNAGVPHLHLEMRRGPAGRQFAGMAYYSTQASQEERDNYVLWRTSGTFQHFDPMSVLASESNP